MVGVLLVVAGVALVLSGTRGLTAAMSDAAATRIRESVLPWLERPALAVGTGIVGAWAGQASALVVLLAMAAVHRGVMGLETAVLVSLGASVGTALKAWLLAWPVVYVGPSLVVVGSVSLLVGRGLRQRRIAHAVVNLGLVYLGWGLAFAVVQPWLLEPSHHTWLAAYELSTLWGLFTVVTAGVLAAMVFQSSTAVAIVVVGVVATGAISTEAGTAVLLGAAVGTAVVPLFASIEYRSEARAIAFINLLMKATGVVVVSLFFRTFVESTGAVASALGVHSAGGTVLVAYTVFAIANAVVWLPMAPFVARRVVGPAQERRSVPFLARSVRRMLARLPEEASLEIEGERDRCIRQSKIILDSLLVACSQHAPSTVPAPYELRARVLGAQELIAEVAVRGAGELEHRFHRYLGELNTLEDLLDELIGLVRRMELESSRVRVLRAVRLQAALLAYRESVESAWAALVHPDRPAPQRGDFVTIERDAYRQLQEAGRVDESDWMEISHQLAILQRVWNRVMDLVDAAESMRRAHEFEAGEETG